MCHTHTHTHTQLRGGELLLPAYISFVSGRWGQCEVSVHKRAYTKALGHTHTHTHTHTHKHTHTHTRMHTGTLWTSRWTTCCCFRTWRGISKCLSLCGACRQVHSWGWNKFNADLMGIRFRILEFRVYILHSISQDTTSQECPSVLSCLTSQESFFVLSYPTLKEFLFQCAARLVICLVLSYIERVPFSMRC